MLDILIKNAEIVDGTGRPGFRADIAVVDKRIASIADNISVEASHVILAQGLHLTPGFIDSHSHSDLTLLGNRQADSSIHQGVTTEIIGNCGLSAAPVTEKVAQEVQGLTMSLEIDIDWRNLAEYLEHLRKPGTAVNVVPLIGHNNVRGAVLGYEDIQPTQEQQGMMEKLVEEAMEQGAHGISTGLYYPPGFFADTEEIIGLARIVAKHGGIYASHIRSESEKVLSAAEEAIKVGIQAEIPVQYSHVKICGQRNWHMIDDLVALLDGKRAKEARLGCDQYPYTASSTFLASILPYWAQDGGGRAIAQRIKDRVTRKRIKEDWEKNRLEWEDRSGVSDWDGILVTDCRSRPEVIGKTLEEIASLEGSDPLDTAMDLISLDDAEVSVVFFDQDEEIVRRLMQHPLVTIGSDSMGASPSGPLGKNSPHPRTYGTFPRVLGRYVREEKTLSLEEAVKKMTSLTAERFNLLNRGIIQEGAWADIVLFDASKIADGATFAHPHQYPEGILYVIVNGEIVINQGEHTGIFSGQIL